MTVRGVIGGTPTETPTPVIAQVLAQDSSIAVHKSICQSIAQDNSCSGTDQSLDGYSIRFDVYRLLSPSDRPEDTIVVALDQGAGSSGKDVSGELAGTFYTVCEVPLAYPPGGGAAVSLNGVPVPNGSNETLTDGYPLCMTVQLTGSGET